MSQRSAMVNRVLADSHAGATHTTVNERRAAQTQATCEARGIAIHRTPSGAYRLVGEGVDFIVADLAMVISSDLVPHTPEQEAREFRRQRYARN